MCPAALRRILLAGTLAAVAAFAEVGPPAKDPLAAHCPAWTQGTLLRTDGGWLCSANVTKGVAVHAKLDCCFASECKTGTLNLTTVGVWCVSRASARAQP